MRIWLGVVVVALLSAVLKGIGPAVLGRRQLPSQVRFTIALLPSVVLAALIVSTIAGPRWTGADPAILAGLAAAAAAWALKAPMMAAVIVAVMVSAVVRLIG
jgi:branched-subunit amino acid transport protein